MIASATNTTKFPRAFAVMWSEIDQWDVLSARIKREFHIHYPLIRLGEISKVRWEIASPEQLASGEVAMLDRVSFDGVIYSGAKEETRMEQFLACPGDLVVSKIRARQGSIGLLGDDDKCIGVSIHYRALTPDETQVEKVYAWLALRSSYGRSQFLAATGGAAKGEISEKALLDIKIPLPSLDVQRAIVNYWHTAQREEADASQALRQVTADLDAALRDHFHARQSHALDALRSRCLVVDWHDMDAWDLKSARAASYRHAGSDLVPMGDFAEDATELAYPKREPEHEWPVYGVNNKEGVVFNQHQKGEDFNAPYKRIREGWFFHNPTRSAVGSLGMVPPVPEDAITSPEYQVWRMKDGVTDVLRDYVAVLITTPLFIDLVRIHRVGAVKQRLYVENLLSIHVPHIPLEEQRQFADRRTAALGRIKLAREHLTAVRAQVSEMILGTRPVPTEETLLEEYHDLVDLELEGELSEAQAVRLREVQTQLDTLDVQDPHEQAINARIRQTGDELDAMLAHLRSLPAKVS